MKFSLVFLVVIFTVAQARIIFRDIHYACGKETNVNIELAEKVREGDFKMYDLKVPDYIGCLMKRVGIMTKDGQFLEDVALSKVPRSEYAEVKRILGLCLPKKGRTLTETIWNYAVCYNKERPNREDFF